MIFGYKNAVVFISFSGTSYSDNPRPISEKLHELSPKTKIVWFFKKPEDKKKVVPPYVICVDIKNKLTANKWLAIAKCVVNNCALADKKGRKQFFVQLWHGDRGIKRVLYETKFLPDTFRLAEEKEGFCDLAVSGSKSGDMQYRNAFRYPGEILTIGTPRNDILVKNDPDEAAAIRKAIGCEGKKILLYAPTFRQTYADTKTAQEKQDIDLERVLSALKEKTGEDWIVLVRSHPSVPTLNVADKEGVIKNVSSYEDMADLLLVTDFLITDFSSSAPDFALLRRSVVLFIPDLAEYLEKDRELCFDMKDGPFFVTETQEELLDLIKKTSHEEYAANCDKILDFYGTNETGKSAEAVAQRLIRFMETGERKA